MCVGGSTAAGACNRVIRTNICIRIRNCSTDMAFDIFNFCDEIFLNICNEIFLSCCSKCSVTQPSYNQGIRKVDTAVKIELATLSAYLNPLEIEPDTF